MPCVGLFSRVASSQLRLSLKMIHLGASFKNVDVESKIGPLSSMNAVLMLALLANTLTGAGAGCHFEFSKKATVCDGSSSRTPPQKESGSIGKPLPAHKTRPLPVRKSGPPPVHKTGSSMDISPRWKPHPSRAAEAALADGSKWPKKCRYNAALRSVDCHSPVPGRFDPWAGTPRAPVLAADAMPDWLQLPSGSPSGALEQGPYPSPRENSSCALLTAVRDEALMLPIWLRYYRRHVDPRDMIILDHASADNATDPNQLTSGRGSISPVVIKVHGNDHFTPQYFLLENVHWHQQKLLQMGFPCVLFTGVDEIVAPDPLRWPGGLRDYLLYFAKNESLIYARMSGRTMTHEHAEPPMNWSTSILAQRHWWAESSKYSKPLLTKIPLEYEPGFHSARPFADHHRAQRNESEVDGAEKLEKLITGPAIPTLDDLYLIHKRGADFGYCMERERSKYESAEGQMHLDRRRKHATDFALNLKRGWLCTHRLETALGTNTTRMPDTWSAVEV